jgi:NAD(P)-dependent dehydrogenase (short-subunit alcohol dehydrogenase family)
MEKTRVVITGSTRGLGFKLAQEFLSRGCAVVVSGRTHEATQSAVASLKGDYPGAVVHGFPCDAGFYAQVEALWDSARQSLGGVDHWINNAGIGQPTAPIWEVPPGDMEAIVRTDLIAVLYGARVVMRGMLKQGSGMIWFMEGHGSDGRIMKGLSVYGAAKRGLRYTALALAEEAQGTGIRIGTLSPGIMITDFTMNTAHRGDPAAWERTKKAYNILADRPETVAGFLAPRILAARKNGAHIAWLTTGKVMARFLTAGITKRTVIEE